MRWVPNSYTHTITIGPDGAIYAEGGIDPSWVPGAVLPTTSRDEPKVEIEKQSGYVTGYRRFGLSRMYPSGEVRLTTEVNRDVDSWLPRKARLAECVNGYGHPAPAHQCSCGYYLRSEPIPIDCYSDEVEAFATCAGWGKVVEHEFGYRCQYAYPLHIVVVNWEQKWVDLLAENYGVAVENWG